MKILIAGALSNFCLETSYKKGFEANGHEVKTFDIKKAIGRNVKFGKFGSVLNNFLPVDPWIHKANRELVIFAKEYKPDVLVCAANNEVHSGSIAFLKSIMPVKVVLIWPDTLFNLGKYVLLSAPFFDLVAAHSTAAVSIFQQYGFKRAAWLPFAGDLDAHYGEPAVDSNSFKYDLTFVGGNRPERERVIAYVIDKFPQLRVKVWGPYWNRTSNPAIKKIADPSPLYGKDFTKVVQSSLISLNIIDDTNYPGCNMRFFEIPAAGGLQLCSACPEMEDVYKNNEQLFYFHSEEELANQINYCISHKEEAMKVARRFHENILNKDNYKIRSEQLLELLNQ
ncbi:MAG TPA: glycosyltransferase [Chitinophagaceae bacterium]